MKMVSVIYLLLNELLHENKPNGLSFEDSKDSDQPGHPPIWSESSLSNLRKFRPLATQQGFKHTAKQRWGNGNV